MVDRDRRRLRPTSPLARWTRTVPQNAELIGHSHQIDQGLRASCASLGLRAARLPVCAEASDLLLAEHGIYIQPINHTTVSRGTERLRIRPTPSHDDALIDAPLKHLSMCGGSWGEALVDVWGLVGLPLPYRALAAE